MIVNRLPYVEATILELLRCKTSVPVILHCTLNDTDVGGYFVPKGTMVRLKPTYTDVLYNRSCVRVVRLTCVTVEQ